MIYIGCHLSVTDGYEAMGHKISRFGGNTFAWFTRNPRGGRTKPVIPEDVDALLSHARRENFGPLVAHGSYTMNLCSAKQETRENGLDMFRQDIARMEMLPGNLYNFHPGSHTGQGIETGIAQIAEALNQVVTPETGNSQGSGYERDSANVSEIAAQGETSTETVSTAAGLLLYLQARSIDLDDAARLSDAQIAELFQFEMRKEFLRLFCQNAIDNDSDATVREAIYRNYGQVQSNDNLERAERLFHSAWLAADASLDADIVREHAEEAKTTQDRVMMAFAAMDLHFACYIFGKARARLAHHWLERPEQLADRRYHAAAMLSLNAKMLASSCTLLVKHGPDIKGSFDDNGTYKCGSPDFLNYLIRRARASALMSINECVRADVPCLNALRLFESADGKNMGEADAEDLLHDMLEQYWAAALDAKALLMGFSKSPKPVESPAKPALAVKPAAPAAPKPAMPVRK